MAEFEKGKLVSLEELWCHLCHGMMMKMMPCHEQCPMMKEVKPEEK